MSIRAQKLFELQQLDSEIDSQSETLARVESQLGETEELTDARDTVLGETERRRRLESDLRSLEWETEDLGSKIAPLEEKLYSGRVKNPKELTGLQHEVEGLKDRRRKAEDQQLELMAELDDSLPGLERMQADLARVEAAWREDQQRLQGEQTRLKADIQAAEERKRALVRLIPQADLDLYAELRETRRGRAVARVERGMCQGCRISLSMNEIQRVRVSVAPARCSSCGRILVVG
ncbi:MAG: hypothetical protein HYX94_14015 [Chloroflexi bacterium]|nr:hypothetical protein [Chloroflexota bacterium]